MQYANDGFSRVRQALIGRRRLVHNAALAGLGLFLAPRSRSAAQAKRSKQETRYQDSPNQGRSCAGCVHFAPPSACRLVEGDISAQGWCSLWTAKR